MGHARGRMVVAGCLVSVTACIPACAESAPADNVQRRAGVFLPSQVDHIGGVELRRLIRERDDLGKVFHLVDLRNEADHAQGAIPGAVNVPLKKLSFVAEKRFGLSEPIVLYGYSADDRASINAVVLLANKGYRNISFYDGGYADWKAAEALEQTGTGAADAKT